MSGKKKILTAWQRGGEKGICMEAEQEAVISSQEI